MTTDHELERRLRKSFDSTPQATTPYEVHAGAMARAARSRQRPSWLVAARGNALSAGMAVVPRTTVWLLVALGLLVVAIASVIVAGAMRVNRQAEPTLRTMPAPTTANLFAAPFEYTLVGVGGLQRVAVIDDRMTVAFVEGSNVRRLNDGSQFSYQDDIGNSHGIVFMSVSNGATHNCPMAEDVPARPPLGNTPQAVIDALRLNAGAALNVRPPQLVDGRLALVADVVPKGHQCTTTDIHTVTGDFTGLYLPSRLFVLEVGPELVLIDVWARSDEGLADWMPKAMELLETVRFR